MTERADFHTTWIGRVFPSYLCCLREIVEGQLVLIWGGDPRDYIGVLPSARLILSPEADCSYTAQVIICVDLDRLVEFLASSCVATGVATGAVVIGWAATSIPLDFSTPHEAEYLQQSIAGVLLADARFPGSKVTLIFRNPTSVPATVRLLLWSDRPLPVIQIGLFETSAESQGSLPFETSAAKLGPIDHRAVAIAGRLIEVEQRTMSLRGELHRLRQSTLDLAGMAPTGTTFEIPKTRHEWPLAEGRVFDLSSSVYDRRPDDYVINQAQRGKEFFSQFAFESPDPDFAGAVAAINSLKGGLITNQSDPDVSIIIPVYGQLPYTLNCIHSLLQHESRYNAEIIIVDDCSPEDATSNFHSSNRLFNISSFAKEWRFYRE